MVAKKPSQEERLPWRERLRMNGKILHYDRSYESCHDFEQVTGVKVSIISRLAYNG